MKKLLALLVFLGGIAFADPPGPSPTSGGDEPYPPDPNPPSPPSEEVIEVHPGV